MAFEALLDTEEERAGRRLIQQAGTILTGLHGDMPESFATQLFARGAPEDLVRYEPRDLAMLAEDAWRFLKQRRPGTPKVRCEARGGAPGAERLKAISILEIVNDNMPFLLDSVMGELTERALEVHLVVHPILTIERDTGGMLVGFRGEAPANGTARRESFIHIHIERIEDPERRAEIVHAIEQVLADVRVCVDDWRAMRARVEEVVAELRANPPPLPVEEIAEAAQFLEWLCADNFTFLGVRESRFAIDAEKSEPRFETGLGILRAPEVRILRRGKDFVQITPEIREFLKESGALIITKANVRSRVHRRVDMDYIGVKQFDRDGKLLGEFRIVGLFTSTVYTRSTRSIGYLRRKVDAVIKRSGFDPDSHSGKALVNVLESYPRDELFQIDEDTLYRFAVEILYLEERPRVRVLARRDRFDRFVSVLVFLPRERYNSSTREEIGKFLAEIYQGRLASFCPFFTEGPLVRVHFIVARSEGKTPNPDRRTLEATVENVMLTWGDSLQAAITLVYDAGKAQTLLKSYREAFPEAYREDYPAKAAIGDIRVLEGLSAEQALGVDFYARANAAASSTGLKVFSWQRPIPLSARVPVLENMGFKVVDERSHRIQPAGDPPRDVWLHDMLLERADGAAIELEALKPRLEACFMMVMHGRAENDGFNALVLAAGLPWRDVALLRAIARFLRQVRIAYSQDYLWMTLRQHPVLSAKIVQLFHTRFDPRLAVPPVERKQRGGQILAEIEEALRAVASLDEDRILRRFVNAVQVALRTNFYQTDIDGEAKSAIAIKFDSRKVEDIPLPRPLSEIFVYSPQVEGVHLRFGKVARGGIRWSDRPQDFRTEILGLVKAQQVKNAVIVPVGAKGGFVPQGVPLGGGRDAILAEGTAAYRLFVSTLLDITDNLGPTAAIPPPDVVRHDDDDPYLVVAADKGTATFSDTANAIALEREFWLGDAFASGGSAGYDHKKMGITARGAWAAVRRHFCEIDIDITRQPFTVAGVGDMSGDVFGNGMLLAQTTQLIAAFDYRDIFIDPDPDPDTSFKERQRLFDLPRSSWQDYDKTKISDGGGVYSRAAKEIELSPRAQLRLGLSQRRVTPQQVMNAILRLEVDLLWFGGIGTYVRATTETDDQVGDRANDAVRVTSAQLRCKVVGEGANLGVTQKGRVEAALRGIRLNTDAIDNSAGVNTSDLEVNIKIALGTPLRDGRLTPEQRRALLCEMTDDVAALVLRNNYMQTLSLSLSQQRGLEDLGFQQRLMQLLETRALLDRNVEALPDDLELADRRRHHQPLTRPELAVLLAYAKLALYQELLASSVLDDHYLGRQLERYFPPRLVERFPDAVASHRLRREIIATQLANSMINRGGPTLIVRIADQTGAAPAAIAGAFAAVRDSFELTELNAEIDALDTKIAGRVQLELYTAAQNLLLDRMVWFLRNADLSKGLADVVAHYRGGIATVAGVLDRLLSPEAAAARDARCGELKGAGVPEDLARRIANLPALGSATDVVLVADRTGKPVAKVAATFFATGAYFQLDRIVRAAHSIPVTDYFDQLARDQALGAIAEAERRLAAEMVGNGTDGSRAVEEWIADHADEVERIRTAVHDIAASGLTVSKLSVTASLLGDLARHALADPVQPSHTPSKAAAAVITALDPAAARGRRRS
jgi:glutamate dehydrogenase